MVTSSPPFAGREPLIVKIYIHKLPIHRIHAAGSGLSEDICGSCEKTYCARILIERVRFPPFGFDTVEMSSNLNENMSFLQEDVFCPDSDKGRSVSPFRVRYRGDKL